MSSRNRTTATSTRLLLIAAILAVGTHVLTQPSARGAQAPTEFTVTESTNFAVAASSGGRMLITDFQGSLWAIPGQGGPAKRITEVTLKATQPAFSPKGDQVVFQGYLDDGWDLWAIAPDGSGARRLTWGPFDDVSPHWSHDGSHIAFSSERSGNWDIWILNLRTGELRQVTMDAGADTLPTWSPDDREIAFVSARSPAGVYAVNVAYGSERLVAAVPGRIGTPSWTPDGKHVMYTVIADGAARLEVSGKPAATKPDEDIFPFRANWTSNTEFIYSSDGKIRRRALGSSSAQNIEFTLTIPVTRATFQPQRRDYDPLKPRKALGIVSPKVSPDGKKVVFSALGDLWSMEIGGTPTRLTSDKFALNVDPAWSPDGSQLVYSSDRLGNGNLDLWVRNMETGRERRLTELPTADGQASWSPDGKRIAFVTTLSHARGGEVHVIDVESGKAQKIQGWDGFVPSGPTWSADGHTLLVGAISFYTPGRSPGIYKLVALPTEGGQGRILDVTPHSSAVFPIDEGPIWSPDGTRIAFVHQGFLNTVDVDRAGNPIGGLRQLTTELAHAPSWTGDSRKIVYLATDQLRMVSVDDGEVRTIPLDLQYRAVAPKGRLVVHAGRVWNGREKTLQADRDIVIEDNRIRSTEPHRASLHAGRVVDASNQTAIPGLIDMHEHIYQQYGEALGRQLLAYGVTAFRDTGAELYRGQEYREMWESGERVGPRAWLSGPIWDGRRESGSTEFYTIENGLRVEAEIERTRRMGMDWIKMYGRMPQALQKRIIEGAHKAGFSVTSHEIYPVAMWGVDGTEHLGQNPFKSSPLGRSYADVIQLIARGGMSICPTLNMGTYSVIASEDPSMLTEERIKVLVPPWALAGVQTRMARLKDTGPKLITDAMAQNGRIMTALLKEDVKITAGTDAPNLPHGQALHAELVTMVRSGLTPVDALQMATTTAAEVLGAGADLGTLEAGKLADLVIVNGDPLSDIKAARNISTVIKNGQVFEMKTLLAPTTGQQTGGL